MASLPHPAADVLTAALYYASRGWPVFPLHSLRNGVCTCHKGKNCDQKPGKHPRTAHGFKDGSTDPAVIRKWWQRWPDANYGIVTGVSSIGVVLDAGGTVLNGGVPNPLATISGAYGVKIAGSAGSVQNHGSISGSVGGVFLNAGGGIYNFGSAVAGGIGTINAGYAVAIKYAAAKGDPGSVWGRADYVRRERFAVQRHTAVMMEPMTPEPMLMPSSPASQPPITAPTIPTTMSPMRPNPPPLTNRPASQPAIAPMISQTMMLIRSSGRFGTQTSSSIQSCDGLTRPSLIWVDQVFVWERGE